MEKFIIFLFRTFFLFVMQLLLFSILIRMDVFSNVYIYYYRIIYINIAITLFLFLLFLLYSKFLKKDKLRLSDFYIETFSTFCIIFLAVFSIITILSMPIDRSYTIYSLADMEKNSERIFSKSEIEESFINGYIIDMESTKRRIEEQVSLGNIEKVDNGYRITEKGIKLVKMLKLYETIFPVIEKRVLYPK